MINCKKDENYKYEFYEYEKRGYSPTAIEELIKTTKEKEEKQKQEYIDCLAKLRNILFNDSFLLSVDSLMIGTLYKVNCMINRAAKAQNQIYSFKKHRLSLEEYKEYLQNVNK